MSKTQWSWEKELEELFYCVQDYGYSLGANKDNEETDLDPEEATGKALGLISSQRTQLLEQVREVVEGMRDKKYGWSTHEAIEESYTEVHNQALDDLLSELSKLEEGDI